MSLLDLAKPIDYTDILGNSKVINYLQKLKDKKSIILWGNPGCGKTSIAKIYGKGYPMYAATELKSEQIRQLCGVVLIDEIQYLDSKKQQLLLYPMVEEGLTIIGTTTQNPRYCLSSALLSRVTCLEVKYPKSEEVYALCVRLLHSMGIVYDNELLHNLCDTYKDLRALLNVLDDMAVLGGINEDNYKQFNGSVASTNRVEELKSAMQKSIRGSDIDASCMYAYRLLEMGQLEILCRRLRIIVSEDIGLACPQAVNIVNDLLDNALITGMPECLFPLMEAVTYMALQPKSNSVHEIVKDLKQLEGIDLDIPASIKYVHSRDYMYPHDYTNNWVNQRYLPINISKDTKMYSPGKNKIEQAYAQYWEKVKGGKLSE